MKHGDFTLLAEKYAQYRPGYAPFVLETFLALREREREREREIHCADVGAGTGIWSRQLAKSGIRVSAVEPNDAMREAGKQQNNGLNITWFAGSAEATGLSDNVCDLVCMASSFHWADFDAAIREFNRILKPGGLFMALWNTRHYEANPLLVQIENELHRLVPDMRRVSSGRSTFCASLADRLREREEFEDVLYVEGRHAELQSRERYIGLWESVNDVRVQAGEKRFADFMAFIKILTANTPCIEAEYTTRAWIARSRATSAGTHPTRE